MGAKEADVSIALDAFFPFLLTESKSIAIFKVLVLNEPCDQKQQLQMWSEKQEIPAFVGLQPVSS